MLYVGVFCLMTIHAAMCQLQTDSLRNILHQLKGTERIHTLNLLSQRLAEDSPDISLAYAMEADSLSKLSGNIIEQAFAKRNLGDIEYYKRQYSTSKVYYESALVLDQEAKNFIGIANDFYCLALNFESQNKFDDALFYYMEAQKIYGSIGEAINSSIVLYSIGFLYDYMGENLKALDYYKQSLHISDSLINEEDVATTLNTIGLLYYNWGDYEAALANYQQSLSKMEKMGNKTGMAQTYNNIGILYHDWGQKDLALDYYMKSLQLEEEAGNEAGLAGSYNNIGIIYADLKEYDKALGYYEKSLNIEEKYNNQTGIATCLNNIGDLHFELGNRKLAIEKLQESLAIERKLENPESLTIDYNTLSGFYHKMGEQKKALAYNDSSYRLAVSINSPEIMMDNYLLYYQIYESLGSYKDALNFHQKYYALKDSLFNENTHRQISEMQLKYEANKKEHEIELLNSKNKLQVLELENKQMVLRRHQIIMYSALSGFVIILFVALLLYYQIRQKKKTYLLLDKKNKEILENRNEIIEAKEKAEEGERLKSSFLSNISHELRTPLNGILGFAEILQKELTDPVYQEMSEAIHLSGNRLLDTLNSIIDLSIIETNKMELFITNINLVDMVREMVLLFKVAASKKNLEINAFCQSKKIIINSDPKILTNLLNNLIDNAIKYTKEGSITVEAGEDNKDARPMIWIKVKDTGIGIPENRREHIFDRFTQVSEGQNREYEGAGLGLTICKKYIEVLQGAISVESELGRGSEFTIRLPVSIDELRLTNNGPEQNIIQSEIGSKPKVLIIDKDKTRLRFITENLEKLCEIAIAQNSKSAIRLALENTYDAILLDVSLENGKNGKSTIREIHTLLNHTNTPITALVIADTPQEQREKLINSGYYKCLDKPFSIDELQDVVYEMISISI